MKSISKFSRLNFSPTAMDSSLRPLSEESSRELLDNLKSYDGVANSIDWNLMNTYSTKVDTPLARPLQSALMKRSLNNTDLRISKKK